MITVIANLKGGTGKSTVTFNLAVWLCLSDIDVKVIDLDPQKTLTDVAFLRIEEGVKPPVYVQSILFTDANMPRAGEETLIDVGTADIESFKQALRIADRVLIPVTPSQADIWSTQRFIQFLHRITQGRPPESITFLNRADTNRAIPDNDEAAAALNSLPGVRLLPQRLCDRRVFRHSFSEGLAVFELEPLSKGSDEFKALAAAVFSQKRSTTIKGSPRKESTPGAANVINRPDLAAPAVGQTVAEIDEYGKELTVAATEESQDRDREVKGKKKKNRATKDKRAKKAKKGKNSQKGMKEPQAKKNKKDKKGKRGK